jgi:hypothetical protein
VFFLRFDHIFDMFHMKRLDSSLVRLYALHLAYVVNKEQVPTITVADPFYMHEDNLISPEGHEVMMEYIEEFILKNKKDTILMPYFPK